MIYSTCYIVNALLQTHISYVFISCASTNIDACSNGQHGFIIPCDNNVVYDTRNCPNIALNNVCNFRTCNNLYQCEYFACRNNIIISDISTNILPTIILPNISYCNINKTNILAIIMLYVILNL